MKCAWGGFTAIVDIAGVHDAAAVALAEGIERFIEAGLLFVLGGHSSRDQRALVVRLKTMKRLIASLASVLGLGASAAPEITTVDPKTIYFSIATLNDALPVLDTSAGPTENDLVIHEDDWRQFEAVSQTLGVQIDQEVSDVQRIFKEKSKESGHHRIFSDVHVRKRIPHPLPTPIVWADLLDACGVRPGSVHGLGLRDGQGMVRGGFAFRIAKTWIFGIRQDDKVEALCFALGSAPGLGDNEAQRLGDFIEKCEVTIVHWPSGTLLRDKKSVIATVKRKNG